MKTTFLLAGILAATLSRAGDSAPFRLDTRAGIRAALATEPLAYSTDWNSGATGVAIDLDGAPLFSAASPASGDYVWNTDGLPDGLHTLTFNDGVETLDAQFYINPGRIVFDANGGEGTMEPFFLFAGTEQTLPESTFTKDGHFLLGWALTPDGEATLLDGDSTADIVAAQGETVTLYAVWHERTACVAGEGLVAYYPFAGTLEDASGNGHEFTDVSGGMFCEDRLGHPDGAMSFNGSGQYVSGTDISLWISFSVACWFQTTVSKTSQGSASSSFRAGNALFFPSHGGSNAGVGLSVGTDGLAVTEHGSSYLPTKLNYSATIGSGWSHVCMVVENNTSVRLYLNGALVASGALSSMAKTFGLNLGGGIWGYYTGKVDDVCVYGKALSESEVLSVFNDASAYAVRFDANGGEGAMPKRVYAAGDEVETPTSAFSKDDFVFVGWATEPDGPVVYGETIEGGIDAANGATVTLYARWAQSQYAVHFNSNGGEGTMADESFWIGIPGGLSSNAFARTGYDFAGWAATANGEAEFADRALVTNLTETANATANLYAAWEPHQYAVRFNRGAGTGSMANQQLTYDTAADLTPNAFTRTGYTFAGWATEADGDKVYDDGAEVLNLATNAGAVIDLYTTWTPNEYMVKFDANGGTGTMSDLAFTYDQAATLTANAFARANRFFAGWAMAADGSVVHTNGAEVANLTAEANGEVTLYAVWADSRVVFNVNGGEGTMEPFLMFTGTEQMLPEGSFTKVGHFLLGWALAPDGEATLFDGDSTADIAAAPGETVTLYAVWHEGNAATGGECTTGGNANWFVQTSDTHDGIAAARSGAIGHSQSTWLETTVTGSGTISFWWKVSSEGSYDYLRFYVDGSQKDGISGGTSWGQKSFAISGDGEHTIRWTYSKDGSVSSGSDCGWVGEVTWPNSDKPHKWVVGSAPPQLGGFVSPYAVRFDANGGEGMMPKRVYAAGDDVTLPANVFARDGWTFVGWATEADGSVVYADEGEIKGGIDAANGETITLYARWAQSQYTVHFDANGGVGTIADESFWIGLPGWLSSNAFSKTGYDFAGWATAADGEIELADKALVTNLTEMADATVNLYAIWSPHQYAVRFNRGAGTGSMANQQLTYDIAANLTSNAFARTGYTFAGWATESDGSKVYDDGEVVQNLSSTNNAVVDLYATWTPNEYTVNFDANGGTGTMSDLTFIYDQAATLTANDFTRASRFFAGWATEEDGGVVYADGAEISNLTTEADGEVTLYAVWADSRVVFDANGGEGTMEPFFLFVGTEQTLPRGTFTKDGHFLLGWALAPDGEATLLDGDSTADIVAEAGETVTLYAVWREGEGGGNGLSVKYYDISSSGYSTWSASETALTNYFAAYTPTIVTNTLAFGETLDPGIAGVEQSSINQFRNWGLNDLRFEADGPTNRFHGKYANKNQENIAALLTGTINTETGGTYSFACIADDYEAIFIDGVRVCRSSWSSVGSGSIELSIGPHTFAMGFHEGDGGHGFAVEWKKPGDTVWSPLPQACLSGGGLLTYAVSFDANGGEGAMAKRVYAAGDEVETPTSAFSKDDFVFVGWATEPDGPVVYGETIEGGIDAANGATVTLYARWAQSQYAVHFNANGGVGTMADESFWLGIPGRLSSNAFTRTGYAFAGWATTENGEAEFADMALVTNLTTTANATANLYAVWAPHQYAVRFNRGAGTGSMPNQTLTYDAETDLAPNAFTRTGYTFAGWAAESNGEKVYDDGAEVLNLAANAGAVVDLYTTWTPNEYTVKFDANGGTGTMADQTFTYDQAATLTESAFTYANHLFVGWATAADGAVVYTDGAEISNLTAEANGEVTLYAVWADSRVVFDANGGEGTMDPFYLFAGTEQTLPSSSFSKGGHFLLGWALTPDGEATLLDGDSTADIVAAQGETVPLYAVWHEWNAATGGGCTTGGNANWFVQTSDTHDGIAAARSGAIGDSQSTWLETTVTGSGTISFWWKVSSDHLSYDYLRFYVDGSQKDGISGGTSWGQKSFAISGDGEHTIRWTYSKDERFSSRSDCGWVGEVTWPNSDKPHKWVVGSAPPQLDGFVSPYAVRFDANGGVGTMPKRVYATGDDVTLTAAAFARDGWTFAGWAKTPDGPVVYANGETVEGGIDAANGATVTLYARWAQSHYTVHFNANGGEGTMADESLWLGIPDTLPTSTFTRTGYTFAGWATTEGGEIAFADKALVTNLTETANGAADLYAVWSPHQYEVRFNRGTGTGSMPNRQLTYDIAANLTSNAFTRTGYTFAGWATEEGGAKVYDDGAEVLNLATNAGEVIDLYTTWTPNAYSVVFSANGGAGTMANMQFIYDEGQALTANAFTRASRFFAGWATEADGSVVHTDGAEVSNLTAEANGDVTLYAVWADSRVVFDANGGDGTMEPFFLFAGTEQTLPRGTFTKDGHFLLGWALAPDGEATLFDGDSTADLAAQAGETVTLYAVWHEGNGRERGLSVRYYDISSSGYSTWTQSEAAMTNYFAAYTPTIETNSLAFGETLDPGAIESAPSDYRMSQMASMGMVSWQNGACRFHGKYTDFNTSNFATLFEGTLTVEVAGKYSFAALADDYIVLYIDGQRVLNGQWDYIYSGSIDLAQGSHTIRVAHYEIEGGQGLTLQWKKPGDTLYSLIPQSVLALTGSATYAIRFDANGGEGTMPKRVYAGGDDVTLPERIFIRDGYFYQGWATSPDGEIVYDPGEMVIGGFDAANQEIVTLYAIWPEVFSLGNGFWEVPDGDGPIMLGAPLVAPSGEVVVPAEIDDRPVVAIGADAFAGNTAITSITIPASVTNVAEGAFAGCTGIRRVAIGSLYGCERFADILPELSVESMEEVVFLDGVAEIPDNFFEGCAALRTMDLAESVAEIGTNVFEACSALATTTVGGLEMYQGWVLGFAGGSLGELAPPDLAIPEEYEDVTARPEGSPHHGTPYRVRGIAAGAFEGETGIATVSLPESLVFIGARAFANCTGLGSVTVPEGVAKIDRDAFRNCTRAQGLALPESLRVVADGAFSNCTRLQDVSIPQGVEEIGGCAFSNCWRVTSVSIPQSVERIGDGAFADCENVAGAVVPLHVRPMAELFPAAYATMTDAWVAEMDGSLGEFATPEAEGGSPGGLAPPFETRQMVPGMFAGCAAVEAIALPEWVRNVPDGAFEGCAAISALTFPGSVTNLGARACASMAALESVTFPAALETIGEEAFDGDSGIVSLALPDGLLSIGERAFRGLSRLARADIPASVREIGADAFAGCAAIRAISMPGDAGTVADAFPDAYASIVSATVVAEVDGEGDPARPEGSPHLLMDALFAGCAALTLVELPQDLAEIGASAFSNCSGLAEVGIPSAVTNIGASAFANCSTLSSIALPKSLTVLQNGVFTGCSALAGITIPEGVGEIGGAIFDGCTMLRSVRFVGNAPAYSSAGAGPYAGVPAGCVTYVPNGSTGWDGIASSQDLPRYWPAGTTYRIDWWDPNRLTISFDLCDGTAPTEVGQVTGTSYVLPAEPTRQGATFGGWWTLPENGARVTASTQVTAIGDYTVYAHWTMNRYAVRFDANGGRGAAEPFEMTVGTAAALPPCPFAYVGHSFMGWATAPDGPVVYADGATVSDLAYANGASVTLYAVWTEREWTLPDYLDAPELVFGTEGGEWSCDREDFQVGGASLTSGELPPSDVAGKWTNTVLRTTVFGEGALSFWWKVSCEPEDPEYGDWFDYATFTVDGVEVDRIAGESGWRKAECAVTGAGTHVLEWTFFRDDYDEDGADYDNALWVDGVEWTPAPVAVSFDAGGAAEGEAPAQVVKWAGYALVLPGPGTLADPPRVFAGWSDGENVYAEGETYVFGSADATLTAVWTIKVWTLGEAVDATALAFTTGGNDVWAVDTAVGWTNGVSAKSGIVANGQSSWIETTVEGAGTLSFRWKVMGGLFRNNPFAFAKIEVDGTEAVSTHLTDGWEGRTLEIADTGTHTVRWTYLRTSARACDGDCAWLDGVAWEPTVAESVIVQDVEIPVTWLDVRAASFVSAAGGDREAAARATAANGRPVWECYVADLDPEDPDDDLVATIEMVDGEARVSILKGESADRAYETQGAPTPSGPWGAVSEESRFFRMKVILPE